MKLEQEGHLSEALHENKQEGLNRLHVGKLLACWRNILYRWENYNPHKQVTEKGHSSLKSSDSRSHGGNLHGGGQVERTEALHFLCTQDTMPLLSAG